MVRYIDDKNAGNDVYQKMSENYHYGKNLTELGLGVKE